MNTKTLPVFIVTALYLLAQLGTGTSIYFAIVISIAVFCGLLSVSAAGGIRSALGALNAILLTKFLLLGIAIKVFTLQAADSILRSPSSTANVMALGFLGLLLGTLLCRYAPKPPIVMVPAVHEARMYLALTIVFTVVGFAGDLLSLGSELQGNGLQTGGILGVARTLSVFKSFGPIAALYFAWANNSKRYLTHPLVLFVVALNLAFGIFSTSKQGIMEPIAFYLLMGFLRYGFRSKPLWGYCSWPGWGMAESSILIRSMYEITAAERRSLQQARISLSSSRSSHFRYFAGGSLHSAPRKLPGKPEPFVARPFCHDW